MLLFSTDIGSYVDPSGTITVRLVGLAAVTVAIVAPKNTILPAGVAPNPVPVIVTDVPAIPVAGLNEVITGGKAPVCVRLMVYAGPTKGKVVTMPGDNPVALLKFKPSVPLPAPVFTVTVYDEPDPLTVVTLAPATLPVVANAKLA